MKNEAMVSKEISTNSTYFTLSVLGDDEMLSLSIKCDDIDDYWDGSTFIAETLYPSLRAYLVSGEVMKFDGAGVLYQFHNEALFELYEILVIADAWGWLK